MHGLQLHAAGWTFRLAVRGAGPFFHVSDERCKVDAPPDECLERAGAHWLFTGNLQNPWFAVIFWYPKWYVCERESLAHFQWDLQTAATTCNTFAHVIQTDYETYAGCIHENLRYQKYYRALVVTSTDSGLACQHGVIIMANGRGRKFSAFIYMLPGLDYPKSP